MSKSIFEPVQPLAPFEAPSMEFQVNIDPATDLGDLTAPEELAEVNDRSFILPTIVFGVLLIVLGVRLINLQVTKSRAFQVLAKGNRVESQFTLPPRGVIVDRMGRDLVRNVPVYSLDIYPARLPQLKTDREAIYQKVSEISGVSVADIVTQLDKHGIHSLEPLTLKNNLDRDTALTWRVRLGNISGVTVTSLPNRSYDTTAGLSHLLGYIGKVTDTELKERPSLLPTSYTGKSGLEIMYDEQLQGVNGKDDVEVDSKGKIQRVVASEPALPGQTLQLYLDKELQAEMAKDLQDGINAAGKQKGVAIAMDPNSGGILAMVSLPSYDNNAFVQPDRKKDRQAYLTDKNLPLFNRAIAGVYPPGSTSKPIWAAAGLQEGIISEGTDIQTPAEIRIGSSNFPDWKFHGHADVKKAIAESNNIFFYAVAGGYDKIKGLGPQKMKEYAEKFGWGQTSGIDLPSEAKGLVPDPSWKKAKVKEPWYIGDTYHEGIGQGYLGLTPLQVVNSINTIANGGTLYEPHLVKSIQDEDGKIVETPGGKVIRKDVVDTTTLRIVREGMRQTVLNGTSRPLSEIPMEIAGKTGTAQFNGSNKDDTHAWFVGFAPYDKPKITVLVMVEGGGESFDVAVPIAKNILSWYSNHSQEYQ